MCVAVCGPPPDCVQQKLVTIKLEQLQACMHRSLCLASKLPHHHLGSPGQTKGLVHAARLQTYLEYVLGFR